MPVHEQRESGSEGSNEQSNYQAVASETIFLLRFLSPSGL